MNERELARALEDAWNSEGDHVERLVLAAAVITTALERAGMRATLVGGGAIEFYAPGSYATTDLDLVVEGRTRKELGDVLVSLGMHRSGRHWVLRDLYVEVPGNFLGEPTDEFAVGPFTLRVIRKESVLADRIVGYRWWSYAAYGVQALDMMAAFGQDLDEAALRARLRKEGAEDTYDLLRDFADSGAPVTADALEQLWQRRYRSGPEGEP
jgi:hypothetical protein